jgi:hypothetical protein
MVPPVRSSFSVIALDPDDAESRSPLLALPVRRALPSLASPALRSDRRRGGPSRREPMVEEDLNPGEAREPLPKKPIELGPIPLHDDEPPRHASS